MILNADTAFLLCGAEFYVICSSHVPYYFVTEPSPATKKRREAEQKKKQEEEKKKEPKKPEVKPEDVSPDGLVNGKVPESLPDRVSASTFCTTLAAQYELFTFHDDYNKGIPSLSVSCNVVKNT